jgi:hypothetical protein
MCLHKSPVGDSHLAWSFAGTIKDRGYFTVGRLHAYCLWATNACPDMTDWQAFLCHVELLKKESHLLEKS